MFGSLHIFPEKIRSSRMMNLATFDRRAGVVRWTCAAEGEVFVVRDEEGQIVASHAEQRAVVSAALARAAELQRSVKIVAPDPVAADE